MCIINKLKLPREGMQLANPNRKWWALIGVSLLGFIGFIDFTIVNTALPSIQKGLLVNVHLSENQQHLIRSLLSEPGHAKDISSQFTSAEAHKILPLFKNAFMQGYSSAMLLLFCISLAAFILVLLVTKKKEVESKEKKLNNLRIRR